MGYHNHCSPLEERTLAVAVVAECMLAAPARTLAVAVFLTRTYAVVRMALTLLAHLVFDRHSSFCKKENRCKIYKQ